jgi:hypothetical protein
METIRDFADRIMETEPVSYSPTETSTRWRAAYSQAGYYPVKLGMLGVEGEWQECHQWCCEHVGEQHYTWTGSTFWFETEQAAALFALRWA